MLCDIKCVISSYVSGNEISIVDDVDDVDDMKFERNTSYGVLASKQCVIWVRPSPNPNSKPN